MKFNHLKNSQKAAALVEYALLIGLIALIAAGAIPQLGQKTYGSLEDTGCQLAGGSYGGGVCDVNVPDGD